MKDADSHLLQRLRAGDRTALEALYRRYADRVWRYGWLRTHDREAAADIVQDTFIRVARYVDRFEGRSSIGTWIYAVARSVAIDHLRRCQRRRESQIEPRVLKLATASGADDRLERREDRLAVRAAILKLRPAQRDAILLCGIGELSIREAAGLLGWSESRTKVTVHRARRNLSRLLSDHAQTTALRASEAGRQS